MGISRTFHQIKLRAGIHELHGGQNGQKKFFSGLWIPGKEFIEYIHMLAHLRYCYWCVLT